MTGMFPPPWREAARKSRQPGHVDCQSDFSPPLASHRGSFVENCSRAGGGVRLEYSAKKPRQLTTNTSEGDICRFIIKGNRRTSGKRKRVRVTNKRCYYGGDDRSTSSLALSDSSSITSEPQSRQTMETLPDLDSWRNKLLLQALRETGDEMKRRRQTLKQVLARHAAERATVGAHREGYRGYKGDHQPRLASRTRTYHVPKINPARENQELEQNDSTADAAPEADIPPHARRQVRRDRPLRLACHEKGLAPDGGDGEGGQSGNGTVASNNDKTFATGPANNRNRSTADPEEAPHRRRSSRSGSRRRGRAGEAIGAHTHRTLVSKAEDKVVEAKAIGAGAVSLVGGSKGTAAADRYLWTVEAAVRGSTTGGKDGQDGDLDNVLCAVANVAVVNRNMRRDSGRSHGGVVLPERSNKDFDSSDEAAVCGTLKVSPYASGAGNKTSDDVANNSLYSRDKGNDTPETHPREQIFRRDDQNDDTTTAPPIVPDKRCDQEVFAGNSTASAPLSAREDSTYVGFSGFGTDFPAEKVGDGCNVPHMVDDLESGQRRAATTATADAVAVLTHQRTPPWPFRGTFWDDEDKQYAGNPAARLDPDSRDQEIDHSIEAWRVGADEKISGAGDRGPVFESASAPSLETVCAPTADVGAGNGGDDADTIAKGTEDDPGREEHRVCADENQNSEGPLEGRAEDGNVSLAGSQGGQEDKVNGEKLVTLSDGGLGRLALLSHTKTEENRRKFFEVYRRMARQVEIVQDTSVLAEAGHTPRQEFIRRMLAMGRVPAPILLRDPLRLLDLNLAHKGLGDDVMCAAAEVLTRLPHIQTLNVAGNRLTDRSLNHLCALVVEMPGLESLDLSSNKVDQAAAIIRTYLAHPSCKLTTLGLRSADVDDGECCHLMAALSRNESLTHLDISAATLAGNASLRVLDLSWNNLRQESAAAIGRALSLNRGLESLNLAHNAFNDVGSQEVGDSLRTNKTLKSLDLSYNGLTPGAAIVIASACKANASLTRLNLNGHRLGRQGSAALLGAIRKRIAVDRDGQKAPPLLLGLSGCDSESDVPGLFDPCEPTGEYQLDMSLPYSRMIVSELVYLSEEKKGYEFDGVWVAKDMASLASTERREKIKLERGEELDPGRLRHTNQFIQDLAEVAKRSVASHPSATASSTMSKPPYTSSAQNFETRSGVGGAGDGTQTAGTNYGPIGYKRSRAKEMVMELLGSVGLNPSRKAMEDALDELDWSSIRGKSDVLASVFRAAFRVYDKNRTGALDRQELLATFQGLGCDIGEDQCSALVSVYDINGSGVMEIEEFVTWMMLEHIKQREPRKGRLMEASTSKPWPIPRNGFYIVSFSAARHPSELQHVETEEGLTAMMENIRHMNTTTERLRMFENAALNTDMTVTAKQAEMLAVLVEHDQDRVITAEKLLGQVINADERAQFLESFLDARQRLRLALRMRGLYRAVMGNPTGSYTLDLRSTRGRLAALKLGEIANAERLSVVARGAADTSQKGNRTPFRNEVLETVPTALSLEWFVRLPRRGQLRMDFVSTAKPRMSVMPLSRSRFEALKAALGVGDKMKEIKDSYLQLETARQAKKAGGDVRIWQQATPRAAKTVVAEPVSSPGDAMSSAGGFDPSAVETATNKIGGVDGSTKEGTKGSKCPLPAAARAFFHFDVAKVFLSKDVGEEAPVPSFEVPDCVSGVHVVEQWHQYRASSHLLFDFFEPAKRGAGSVARVSSMAAGGGGMAVGAATGTDATTGIPQRGNKRGDSETAAARGKYAPTRLYRWVFHRLLVLQTSACAAWYTCEQAMEIADSFPWQDFGRVQAIISMFSRIIDVERFSEIIIPAMLEVEERELQHRLGLLNILNPVRPDASYELDLRSWENREWAKILIKLAVEEPGPNWADMSYTHARGVVPIWGWLLPESWTREDEEMGGDGGPRRTGILCLRYLTDPSIGCIAREDTRRMLQARTLGGIKREL